MPKADAPILITGSHRSGTTWVGQMLCLSGEAFALHEPFNADNRHAWLGALVEHPYQHIGPHNAERYHEAAVAMLAARPPLARLARTARKPGDVAGTARHLWSVAGARLHRRRLIIKDPLAFFAAPWLVDELGVQPLLLVRHPAAFAGSLKQLSWAFEFRHWVDQPELLKGELHPFAAEIRAAAATPPDIIDQAILLWRAVNAVALHHRDERGWPLVRYEDLAQAPMDRFGELYHRLGLRFDAEVVQRMGPFVDRQGGTPASSRAQEVRRDSATAMWTWVDRLAADEVARVRAGTADVADQIYADEDWSRPEGL